MIRIINWKHFQSYRDRKPPWIRFHRSILDNYEFQSMSDNARALLPMLWLLASEHEDPLSGLIDYDIAKISFRLRQTERKINDTLLELKLNGFIELNQPCNETVTKPYKNRNETVTPETETETETETEKRQKKNIVEFDKREVIDIFEHWKKICNHPRAQLDAKRQKLITDRGKNGYSRIDLKDAIEGCKLSEWHQGDNERNMVYDSIELIFRDSSHVDKFIKIKNDPRLQKSLFSTAGRKTASAAENFINGTV